MKQKDLQDSAKRAALGKLSGLVGIVCNVGLAGSKLAVGKLAGSMSITADGLNNLSDAASSIVTLTGFKLAEKPADKEHPYGHARFEYLASLTVSVMILFIGFELAKSSVEKALHPVAVEFSLYFPNYSALFFYFSTMRARTTTQPWDGTTGANRSVNSPSSSPVMQSCRDRDTPAAYGIPISQNSRDSSLCVSLKLKIPIARSPSARGFTRINASFSL